MVSLLHPNRSLRWSSSMSPSLRSENLGFSGPSHIVFDCGGHLGLGSVADELVHSAALPYIVLESLQELCVGLDSIDVTDEGSGASEELGGLEAVFDVGCVGINSIGGNVLITSVNVKSREWRTVVPLEVGTHGYSS